MVVTRRWAPCLLALALTGCPEDPGTVSTRLEGDASMPEHEHLDNFTPGPSVHSGPTDNSEDVDLSSGDACTSDAMCGAGATCFQGTCVGEGALRFSLSWEEETDLDLHVITPDGTEIYYGNSSGAGGYLDVDDCVGDSCRTPGGTHVENIFFEASPMSGMYTYWVHNYAREIGVDFRLEVAKNGGVVATQRNTVLAVEPAESMRYIMSY
jgi:uncharacterized protein YfaP (DUF2135 family)